MLNSQNDQWVTYTMVMTTSQRAKLEGNIPKELPDAYRRRCTVDFLPISDPTRDHGYGTHRPV